jgi:CRISPR-associated protein Cas1
MRKLLNTLYITTPESYLSKDGLNVVVSVKQEEIFRIPIINLESIITFGYMGASPGLMKLCSDNNVSLSFMSPSGQFIGRIQGNTKGNVLLRKKQYLLSDDNDKSLHISQLIISAKIQNSRNVLRRYIRDYGNMPEIENAATALDYSKKKSLKCNSMEQLRGIEGDAANTYFGIFNFLIRTDKKGFEFNGRNKRPPKDRVNAMLSFAYTLLANETAAALESVGLDPYVGFMHTLRPGRASLALDIMEELRAYLGDRFVLTLINRKQVNINDFIEQGDTGIIMTDNFKKDFIRQWQGRKKEEITHPFLNEKIQIGLLPYAQALLLARYIREDINDYPVFLNQ